MKVLFDTKERTRFLKFIVVGTIGAVVDFGVFNVLIEVFHLVPVWANVISFSLAVVSNFILNRFWTYPDSRSKDLRRQVLEFLIVSIIGLSIRTPIFALLENPMKGIYEWISIPLPFDADFVGHNLALGMAVIVVMFWNFYVNRYWTYSDID